MNEPRSRLKAGWKLFLFFLVLVASILELLVRLLFTPKKHQQNVKFLARKQFCKRANQVFGVRLVIKGKLPPVGCYLYISNHRSFYDPVALLSFLVANPVSKAEVSRYPIIGWGTRLTEVLMLERSEKEERQRMKNQIYECLRDETSILVYPEGTTSSALYTDSFKKGAFESAVRAHRNVIPVAMEYPNESYYWIDRPLYSQFLYQMVRQHRDSTVYLSVGSPVIDTDPIELMNKTKEAIDSQIQELRQLREKR